FRLRPVVKIDRARIRLVRVTKRGGRSLVVLCLVELSTARRMVASGIGLRDCPRRDKRRQDDDAWTDTHHRVVGSSQRSSGFRVFSLGPVSGAVALVAPASGVACVRSTCPGGGLCVTRAVLWACRTGAATAGAVLAATGGSILIAAGGG